MALVAELKGAWRVYRDRRKELADEEAQPVDLVYTDKLGNRWYAFRDPLRMPGERALSALVSTRRSDLNFTLEDAKAWWEQTWGYANSGNFMDVGYMLRVYRDRLDWACEENSLLDVAQAYFMINEEPQGAMREKWQQEKRKAWADDEDARGFFLREAYWLTRGFSELSPSDIPTYLAAVRTRIQKASNERRSAKPGGRERVRGSAAK